MPPTAKDLLFPLDAEEASEELLEMIEQLKKMQSRLNLKWCLCGACGAKRFDNHRDRGLNQVLGAAVGRLERAVSIIGKGLDEEQDDAPST
jgi:hypothetical protein